jgi:hypothetical protein
MGVYVNPPNEPTENWLLREGTPAPLDTRWAEIPSGHLPVVLVAASFGSKVAAIGHCESELNQFQNPSDQRAKVLFIVPVEKLTHVSPQLSHYLEPGKQREAPQSKGQGAQRQTHQGPLPRGKAPESPPDTVKGISH